VSTYASGDGYEPMPDYNDAADDEWERKKRFIDHVDAAADKLRINKAAKDVIRAEEVGEVIIPELTRLDDFLAEPIDPITHRIDGLWPIGGRVVLAAQWKAGKTTLRDNVIRSLVDGHTFLGVHHVAPLPGPVILLDFELDRKTLQRWLRDQGYEHQKRIYVLPMKGRVGAFNILDERLRSRWVDLFSVIQPATIMVDCLRPILDALHLDENHEVGQFLGPLDDLVGACGATETFLVHHMGHGAERSRGDSRLRDWPDAEWNLVRDKDDEDPTIDNPAGARYFSAYGRDVDHPQTELTYDPETRHLTIGIDAGTRKGAVSRRTIGLATEAILAVLADQPGLNKRALRMACKEHGATHNPAIDEAAQHLEKEGLIRVVKVGQTHLHYLADPQLTPLVPTVPSRAQGTAGERAQIPLGFGRTDHTLTRAPDEKLGTVNTESTKPPGELCSICHTREVLPGRGLCQEHAGLGKSAP
jgi:AAA domain